MSYRCEICQAKCPPSQPRLVHIIYREKVALRLGQPCIRKEIAREVPVCGRCKAALDQGTALAELIARHAIPLAPILVEEAVAVAMERSAPVRYARIVGEEDE